MENYANSEPLGQQEFLLFVSGMSVRSVRAIDTMRQICDQYLKDRFVLSIIDISRDKEQALQHQIIAVPTLIRISPLPKKIVVGDLSDTAEVIAYLDLAP